MDVLINNNDIEQFRSLIWHYYEQSGRSFAWRRTDSPYHILVSEVMLQQTQTYRVEPKYEQFLLAFPDIAELAQASLRDVLFAWQGLGYNRRALALQATAKKIVAEHDGVVPDDPVILITLPGIGKATAASICAFAFNKPTVFIETNLRALFIHHFFKDKDQVTDKQLVPLVELTLDRTNPRHWYYALMDYGVYIKKMCNNPARTSAHYTKQSKFEGSDRQIRGNILKLLTRQSMQQEDLVAILKKEELIVQKILNDLCQEGFIKKQNNAFLIA